MTDRLPSRACTLCPKGRREPCWKCGAIFGHQHIDVRDRIYVVFWRGGLNPDLELELQAWCPRCDGARTVRQAWKNGRTVGRYRQQYVWACVDCGAVCEPATNPAAQIIDWQLGCPRIGDRKRPLAAATRARILAGLRRYGWVPVVTAGAGHVYETTPGNRARPLTSREAYGLLMRNNTGGAEMCTPTDEPARTVTTKGHQSLVLPYYGNGQAQPVDRPMPTVPTRDRFALVDVEQLVDDCGFRMLEPHEIAAAMAFPDGHIPASYTKKDRVKLAGNAVTPPVMQWITGRLLQAMEASA